VTLLVVFAGLPGSGKVVDNVGDAAGHVARIVAGLAG
jgi:hypothetical protein